MSRRPPRSTLFPTRRSSDLREQQFTLEAAADFLGGCRILHHLRADNLDRDSDAQLGVPRLIHRAHAAGAEQANDVVDRKSTRLNSSHSQISYAVFCLKKKRT